MFVVVERFKVFLVGKEISPFLGFFLSEDKDLEENVVNSYRESNINFSGVEIVEVGQVIVRGSWKREIIIGEVWTSIY